MSTAIEVDVRNPSGLHARPAAVFVRAASAFRADVRVANVTTGSREVNAKSILGVLGIGASSGHRIRVRAEGADEADAARVLADLVVAGLGEMADGAVTG
jgi:phosphotransferase system HPr (HPr) family protein